MFSKLIERIKYFFFDVENDWEIGFSKVPIDYFLAKKQPPMHWFKMPRNVFWADPFGIYKEDKYFVFYEEFNKSKEYGTINCLMLNNQFEIIDNKVVIDEGIHFSFPYVFEFKGEYFMLPETCQKNEISLYKSTHFPFEWKQEKVILNIPGMDNMLFYHSQKWWLIYSSADSEKESIYYVRSNEDLFTDWEKCNEQIVYGSLYNSRSGGSVFEHENELYRIMQNCTDSYGQSVVINKIVNLSETDFREEAIKEIKLTSYLNTGFHTISKCGSISFIDRRRERLFLKPIGKMFKSVFSKFTSS